MYKITIDLSAWGTEDEVMTIETFDFDKIEILREFIEFQKDHGWAADYALVEEFDETDDGYFYDEETDVWYWYDEESDEWVEVEFDGEEEEESEEDEEDEADESDESVGDDSGNTYIFNITQTAEEK